LPLKKNKNFLHINEVVFAVEQVVEEKSERAFLDKKILLNIYYYRLSVNEVKDEKFLSPWAREAAPCSLI
jgi:hypothetical protein